MSSLVSHPSGCAPACASRQQRCGVHSPEPVQLLCQSLSWKPPCHSGLQSHRRCLQKQAEEIPISDQLLYHWLVPSLAWWCFRCVWHQRSPSVSFITHIHTCTHMHTHYTHAHTLHAHTLHTCTHITRTHMHTHAHNMHTHYTTCTHMHTHYTTCTHITRMHTHALPHTHTHTLHTWIQNWLQIVSSRKFIWKTRRGLPPLYCANTSTRAPESYLRGDTTTFSFQTI